MTGSRGRTEPAAAQGRSGGAPATLRVRQPRTGYRYNVDSVLLADFAAPLCGGSALDLGTGCGVILLFLAALRPGLCRGVGVEIQPRLLSYARANIDDNDLGGRLEALPGDFRGELPALHGERFDLVVCNPPYRRVGEGRQSPDPEKEIARHEVAGTMADAFRAAARHVAPRGRFATLCLPDRLPELFACAAAAGLFPERLRPVHPFAAEPANVVLFAGSPRRPPRVELLPPLVVYAAQGEYSAEVERIYRTLPRLAG